jgi:hypothetical protein
MRARHDHDRDRRGDGQDERGRDHLVAPATAALERAQERVHVGPAMRRIGGEPAPQRGPLGPRQRRAAHRAAIDRGAQLDDAGAAERPGAAQRLPHGDAVRELIGARPGGGAVDLLGRHVRRGAEQRADLGEVAVEGREVAALRGDRDGLIEPRYRRLGGSHRAHRGRARGPRLRRRRRRIGDRAGQAEVGDDHAPVVVEQDVVRLEVTVDQPDRVGGGQPAAGVAQDALDLAAPRRRLAGQPLGHGLAADDLHRHEVAAVGGPDLVNHDHVGMTDLGHRARLPQEAGPLRRPGVAVAQHLERDLALEIGIVRRPDHAHAAAADDAEQPVPPELRARDQLGGGLAERSGDAARARGQGLVRRRVAHRPGV